MSLAAARDVREGGAWSPSQRAKNDALWLLASFALAVARALPPAVLRRLGRALGRTAHALARETRAVAERNVARAFPELPPADREALVRRCFASLGGFLGDAVASLHEGASAGGLEVTPAALAVLSEARREGRGVVFPSAHLGPWERVAASLVAAGVPLVTLARESYDARFTRLYERLRGRAGVGVIWRAAPGAQARILRTLRSGGVLGAPMDLRSRVASQPSPFLGAPALTATGPARLALRSGAAVVVGTAAPGDGAELVVTATRIDTRDLSPDGAGVTALTARINAELSARIRALPHAWVWMHDRWEGTPPDRTGL